MLKMRAGRREAGEGGWRGGRTPADDADRGLLMLMMRGGCRQGLMLIDARCLIMDLF